MESLHTPQYQNKAAAAAAQRSSYLPLKTLSSRLDERE